MPRLDATAISSDEDMDLMGTGAFQFSGTRMERLEELSSDFTLVTMVVDTSYSVDHYIGKIQKMCAQVVEKAKKDANSDKILIRLLSFSDHITEVFGFKPATDIDPATIQLSTNGATALYDASQDALTAALDYGVHLYEQDCTVNVYNIVITDGEENVSQSATVHTVALAMENLKNERERIESSITTLVGVGNSTVQSFLNHFQKDAGFDQYEAADQFDDATIARITNFVSASVSAQSQAIGSGGPSKKVTF